MLNPIRSFLEWRDKSAAAEALYLALTEARKRGGVFSGIDIPKSDPGAAAILLYLLKKHPDVRVVLNAKNFTLCFAQGLEQGLAKNTFEQLATQGIVTDVENFHD